MRSATGSGDSFSSNCHYSSPTVTPPSVTSTLLSDGGSSLYDKHNLRRLLLPTRGARLDPAATSSPPPPTSPWKPAPKHHAFCCFDSNRSQLSKKASFESKHGPTKLSACSPPSQCPSIARTKRPRLVLRTTKNVPAVVCYVTMIWLRF
jgi:hypothetical protein